MSQVLKAVAPVVLVLYFCAAVVGPAWGEEAQSLSADQLKINQEKYNSEKKDTVVTMALAWSVPSLGHFYAGDWGRAGKFVLFEAIGLGLMIAGYNQANSEESDNYSFGRLLPSNGNFQAGIVILAVARVWEVIDANSTAIEFNEQLKKKYGLSFYMNTPSQPIEMGLTMNI